MIDQELVQKKAKVIMDSFLKAIENIPPSDIEEKKVDQVRQESPSSCEESFRSQFLRNAPKKSNDLLQMEKSTWK